jgi:hypothetical protein
LFADEKCGLVFSLANTIHLTRATMNVETIRDMEELLEGMSLQELVKFTKQCICQKLYASQISAVSPLDPNMVLDMIHTEYLSRGLEKHYDMAYESVAKNPDVCNAA